MNTANGVRGQLVTSDIGFLESFCLIGYVEACFCLVDRH